MIEVKFYDINVLTDPLGDSWGWVSVRGSLDDVPATWVLVGGHTREFYVHESDPIWGEILSVEEIEAVADRLIAQAEES